MKNNTKNKTVSSNEYNFDWIKETWGWDTPEHFINTQGKNLRPRILAALKISDLTPGMRILDVGCGRGEVVLHCARLGIDGTGVDYSKQAIEIAEQAKATHSVLEKSHMQFFCDDIKNLPIDKPFDRIFLLDVVEHLHDWELIEVLNTCYMLLKPKGALIIHTLPNKWLYDITYSRIIRLFMPWLPRDPRTEKEKKIHVNEMTISHLCRLLTETGFKSRVWLHDLIVEQSHWHEGQPLRDRRRKVYELLNNEFFSSIYRILAKTPLRLLIVNEMFAVSWKSENRPKIKLPLGLTEKFVISMLNRKKHKKLFSI